MTDHLLPPSASPQERALALSTARISDVPVPIRDLWNPEACPVALLPWLAWALSVDSWSAAWSEETQRAVVAASIEVHRRKGTPWSIRTALQAMGYGGVQVLEWRDLGHRLDGAWLLDGSRRLDSGATHWAVYWIVLNVAAVDDPTLNRIVARAQSIAPARCHLTRVYRFFLRLDGTWRLDGSQNLDGGIEWQT